MLDYGPSRLGAFGGCWASEAPTQNFTEDCTNLSGSTVQVDRLSVWTCNPGFKGLTYVVKVLRDTDADGVPAVSVFEDTFGGQDL